MIEAATEPRDLDLTAARAALLSRDLSSVELLESVLERAKATEPVLHAYVEILVDSARHEAGERDRQLVDGTIAGPMHGIPVAIKDIIDVQSVPTRCGSRAREHVAPAQRDAGCVESLRAAGAVIIGKTVTQEFAAGVVSPPARNPWDPRRIPGGSSGGSAVSVAARSAMAAIGTDTGGSVIIPSSLCGITGLKPTYGTFSTSGVFPLAPSLDTVGLLTRSVRDSALLFATLSGGGQIAPESGRGDSAQFRLGIPGRHFYDQLQAGVAAAMEQALDLLRSALFDLVEVAWDDAKAARSASYVINRVETAGVHRAGVLANPGLYGEELVLRVTANSLFPVAGYFDALKARTRLRDSMKQCFDDNRLDALIVPALPVTALPADDLTARYPDGSTESVSNACTRFTMPFNLTGQPTLTIPCGRDGDGLPVGLLLAGRPFEEPDLLRLGSAIEHLFAGHFGAGWSVAAIAGRVSS